MLSGAIVIADASGVISYWSEGAERLLGHSASSTVGRTLDVIVPEHHRVAHWAGFKRAVASGKAGVEGQVGDFEALLPDGTTRLVPGRLTLIREASGKVVAAMVVFG